jgi:SAM-dependent methyltransferase
MTDWEAQWRAGETPWDKGEAAPPLAETLAGPRRDRLVPGRVLVPGCGSGHDVRALAAAGAEVVGLDVSETALRAARAHDPAGGETYAHGDFFEWRDGEFDALWEHTCFCAIPPGRRADYAAAAAALVRPGGHLVGVFFLDPWDPGEVPDPPPFGADAEEIVGHLAPDFEFLEGWAPGRTYPGRENREWLACFRRRDSNPEVAGSAGLL